MSSCTRSAFMGHLDSVEFPDSIMGSRLASTSRIWAFIISKIDREVLQIMYMSQRTDLYNDWGEWSDTAFHVMGESEDGALRFGVALFNGLPQPWASGVKPDTDLADNAHLSGTATWTGALLGFSGASPIAGDAELEVNLTTLADDDSEQDLRFRRHLLHQSFRVQRGGSLVPHPQHRLQARSVRQRVLECYRRRLRAGPRHRRFPRPGARAHGGAPSRGPI